MLESSERSPRIAREWGKVARMVAALASLLAQAEVDAAEEGFRVIRGMLVVGLIFIAVIALGETLHWLRHRRR
jgi:hypothetical protein